jgi:hypothetical protein
MFQVDPVKLPSGALLKMQPAPFADAKALYQALLKSAAEGVKISNENEMVNIFKDLYCTGFSSPAIEACLWKCFERCLYTPAGGVDSRITPDTFEPVACREDYTTVCLEVAKLNVYPFVKTLFAGYQDFLTLMGVDQPSSPKTIT